MLLLFTIGVIMNSILPAMAYDHDQTYNANAVYFVQEDIRSDCGIETVDIWFNTSAATQGGRIAFEYTYCCANVTDFTFGSGWASNSLTNLMDGRAVITPVAPPGQYLGPGLVHIGTATIECCDKTDDCCCGTDLTWVLSGGYESYLEDSSNNVITPINWANGTFI